MVVVIVVAFYSLVGHIPECRGFIPVKLAAKLLRGFLFVTNTFDAIGKEGIKQ